MKQEKHFFLKKEAKTFVRRRLAVGEFSLALAVAIYLARRFQTSVDDMA
jgi:hypothetical protein